MIKYKIMPIISNPFVWEGLISLNDSVSVFKPLSPVIRMSLRGSQETLRCFTAFSVGRKIFAWVYLLVFTLTWVNMAVFCIRHSEDKVKVAIFIDNIVNVVFMLVLAYDQGISMTAQGRKISETYRKHNAIIENIANETEDFEGSNLLQ
jgi:hypothetical protein